MPSGDSDNLYNIGTSNKYAVTGSEEIDDLDPSDLIRQAQERPKKEKEPKTKVKKDVKNAKTNEKKTVKIETSTENENDKRNDRPRNERGRGRGRGGRGRGRGGGDRGDRGGRGRGGFRNNYSPNSNNNQEGFGFDNNNQGGFGSYQTQVADSNEGGFGSGFGNEGEERRGGRSGIRGGRGGRGGRGRGRGGNREFDRKSGSDKSSVKHVDKRDGSGSYNWGTPQDEINAATEESTGFGAPSGFGAPKETDDAQVENTEQAADTEETPVEEPVVDEGPQEMTFEEYKKQQTESRKQPEFNLRIVDQDKKLKQLKKPTEQENESKSSFFFPKKNAQETYKTSGREPKRLDLEFRVAGGENRHMDQSRRGNRGNRERGKRNGGGRKDDSKKEPDFALTKDEDFPSL